MADSSPPNRPHRPYPSTHAVHPPGAPRKDPTVRGRTVKVPPKPEQGDALRGKVEVVANGEPIEATRIRARVQGSEYALRGMSLRRKIMIAMAGLVVVTTLLIFVVVYVKAVAQLSAEIDAKGAAQAQLMASIDPEIWLIAMYQHPGPRHNRLVALVRQVDRDWNPESAEFKRLHKDLKEKYDSLLKGSIGSGSKAAAVDFLRQLVEVRKQNLDADAKGKLDERLKEALGNPQWEQDLNALFDPFAELRPLKAGGVNLLESEAIVQLSVLDITRGTKRDEIGGSVAAADGEMDIKDVSNQRQVGNLNVFDGFVEGRKIPVRSFQLDSPELKTRLGTCKLRYFVLLGLRHIEEAKGTLRTIIFLAIFLALLVGLAIAWWISERISEPVRLLMADINAVSGGDLEHETIPRSTDEIGQLALSFNRMTKALKTAHNQELEQKALEHELNIASEIQANLVPKKIVRILGYDISAYYRPSKEVGGDYYDFIEIDNEHCGFVVADVSGKGVPGSLVMSMARAFIRMEAERTGNKSPADTLKRANKMLAADIKKGMFVTAMYCILNKVTNELAVSSAGHNPMIVWRAAGNEIQLVNPKGIALGFDKGPMFERTVSEETVQLRLGDRVVIYTDGVVESMNERREEFGDKRFHALVQRLATMDSSQFLALLVKALDDHKGSAPQHDDMTIVTFRFAGGT